MRGVQRRDCLIAAGALLPTVIVAQPARKVYRIGILGSSTKTSDLVGPQPQNPGINAFLHGLRKLGYLYGEHFVTEPRSAEGKVERFSGIAAELVDLRVDVIVAGGPALDALKQAASTALSRVSSDAVQLGRPFRRPRSASQWAPVDPKESHGTRDSAEKSRIAGRVAALR